MIWINFSGWSEAGGLGWYRKRWLIKGYIWTPIIFVRRQRNAYKLPELSEGG